MKQTEEFGGNIVIKLRVALMGGHIKRGVSHTLEASDRSFGWRRAIRQLQFLKGDMRCLCGKFAIPVLSWYSR